MDFLWSVAYGCVGAWGFFVGVKYEIELLKLTLKNRWEGEKKRVCWNLRPVKY